MRCQKHTTQRCTFEECPLDEGNCSNPILFHLLPGTTIDWEVSLQLSSAGPSSSVPPGWYMAPDLSHDLFGNVPINGLNEWNVQKLGWFKSRRSRDHIQTSGQNLVRNAFQAKVRNCRDNLYDTEVWETIYSISFLIRLVQRFSSDFIKHGRLNLLLSKFLWNPPWNSDEIRRSASENISAKYLHVVLSTRKMKDVGCAWAATAGAKLLVYHLSELENAFMSMSRSNRSWRYHRVSKRRCEKFFHKMSHFFKTITFSFGHIFVPSIGCPKDDMRSSFK